MASLQDALAAAVDRHQAGDLAAAETLYRRIIDAAPETAAVWHYLGLLLGQSGRLGACAQALRRAVALAPWQADSYRQLAKACAAQSRRADAFSAGRACARLAPDDAAAAHGAGIAALALGDGAAAMPLLTQAAALAAEYIDGLQALVGLTTGQADWPAARRALRRLLALRPAAGDDWETAGGVADRLNDAAAAQEAFRRALIADADKHECWANLSRLRRAGRRPGDAWTALVRAVALAPDDPGALDDVTGLTLDLGDSTAAAAWAARACRFSATDAAVWRQIVVGLYCDDVGPEARFARYQRFAERRPAVPRPRFAGRPAGAALRIGYISADLWGAQPVVRNLLPVLRHNDPSQTALYFYVDTPREDGTTAEIAGLAAAWRNTRGQSDAQVAELIRADGVDVLVFLAGHFDRNRLSLAARRAAPVQISFHDVAASGSPAMDFLISDRVMTPGRGGERFTERPLRPPHFYIADLPSPAPPVNPLPAQKNGHITFGCFNNPAKLSDETLGVWGRLLARLPTARLHLRYFNYFNVPACADRVKKALSAHGVAADRLHFPTLDAVDRNDHLKLYHDIDVALDPFPFSGSTTSFEALCMGVPVTTWGRDRMVGRWTASMLDALRLNELIADSADAYIAIAAGLADDLNELAALRAGLRDRVAASPLTDAKRKARELQRLYRAAWSFCAKSK